MFPIIRSFVSGLRRLYSTRSAVATPDRLPDASPEAGLPVFINRWFDETPLYDGSENDVWHDDHDTVNASVCYCLGLA